MDKWKKNVITGVVVFAVALVVRWLWLPDGIIGLFED